MVPTAGATPVQSAAEVDNLAGKVSKGLQWSFLNSLVGRVVSVVSGVLMARLLAPEDFGVYATALLVVNVLFGLNDLGLLMALVRWPGDLRTGARTALTLATSNSLLMYGLAFLAAAPYAEFMDAPQAVPLLRVLALTIIIDGLTTAPHGLLVRDFAQQRLAMAEFMAAPVGIAVGLALAVSGAGPWALVGSYLSGNLVMAVVIWVAAPVRPRPGFNLAAARWMLAFGGPLALTSVLEYVLLNADYLIVGKLLGPVALGFYLLAYNISNWPVAIISDAVRRVSIPGFARLEADPSHLRDGFRRTFVVMLTVSIPLVLGLVLLAEDVVRLLYGSRWVPAAGVLTWLAVLGGVRVGVGYVFDLLVGVGRTRLTLGLKALWLAVLLPALWWAARTGGIERVGMVHATVGLAVVTPLFLLATRTVGVGLRVLALELRRPFAAAVLATAAASVPLHLLADGWGELVTSGSVLLGVYVVVALPWRSLQTLRSTWTTRRRTASHAESVS